MPNIAFLGLGLMGTPIATRLVEAGNDVTVWNRTPARTEPFVALGASIADSPAKAIVGAEYVITMLATPQAVEDVLFGHDGFAAALTSRQVWVDMSTIGPREFKAAASRLPTGVPAVDAPVRGSVPEATNGRLQIFVGSNDDIYERVHSLLAPLGDQHHVGPPGAGAAMKLVVNLTLVAAMVGFGEAVALADGFELDRTIVMEVLSESPIGPQVRAKRTNVETSHYPPGFKLGLAAKDMALAGDAAADLGIDLLAADADRQWLERAVAAGRADLDFSAVVESIVRTADSSSPDAGRN